MRQLFMAAAALTIAFASQGQAASAKNPLCDLAKSQRNVSSWNEHYGCLKPPARQALASAQAPTKTSAESGPGSQFCEMAKNQRNAPSWNEYYGCLRR